MSSTQYFNLNINPQVESAPPVVHVSQFDNTSRQVVFSLYDNDAVYNIPSGTKVKVEGTKGDNTGFSYDCSFSGNQVTVTITEQMTMIAGPVMCELMLTSTTSTLGTANFFLRVEPAAMRSDVKISETDIPAIRAVTKYASAMETDADRAAKSAAAAKTSETNAANSAASIKTSETNAANSATAAAKSASAAKASETNVKTSETNAANSATAAASSASESKKQAGNASTSATQASTYAANASKSADAAKTAQNGAEAAKANADKAAKSWAVGGTGTRNGEDTDNAKYYSEIAKSVSSTEGLMDKIQEVDRKQINIAVDNETLTITWK